jgi:predicted O-methyltransferase YrrM
LTSILQKVLKNLISDGHRTHVDLQWLKRGGWIGTHATDSLPKASKSHEIEAVAAETNALGEQPLASEYGETEGKRSPDAVRCSAACGDFYAWLVHERKPSTVIEFGSAFGVSGMYFGAGMEASGHGHLYSFEINPAWAEIARKNISSVTSRFTLTLGAFEDHVATIPGKIDLALVDGIHTYDFVLRQFNLLSPRMSPGGIIAFDDIDFPKPGNRMADAWREIYMSPNIAGAMTVDGHVGIVELTDSPACG